MVVVDTDKPVYYLGEIVNITGEVWNSTSNPIPDAMIGIEVKNPGNQTIFLDIVTSHSNGTFSDSFGLASQSPHGVYHVYVSASAPGYPIAVNNTAFTVTLLGDVDLDLDVDIFDIVRMASAYGVSIPDPAYDPNSDIDDDGDVDIFDIVSAAGNYGQNW